MINAVSSGKGGTGKTTDTTSLAWVWDRMVTAVDLDVEEPNLHLFLKPEILGREIATIEVPVALPKRSVKRIASVKGTFYAMLPGQEATFEFEGLQDAKNLIQKRAGITVTVERVTKNRSVYEVRVKLRLDRASDSLQSHLDWASNNEAYLVDANGVRIENPTFERYLERSQEIGFAYLFPISGSIDGYRFVYKSPAAIIELPVEYELKDIALP